MNALESNRVHSLQVVFVSWSCLRAVGEEGWGRRGGGGGEEAGCGGCRGKREVESNEVTPWQPGDSSHSAHYHPPPSISAFPVFPLGPL